MKYKQTIIPEVSTKNWTGFSAKETRAKMFDYYQTHYTGKRRVINQDLGITVEFERAGSKKTAYGGSIYPQKACLVEVLDKLIRYAEYNNFGCRKEKDERWVVGYLNFKVKVYIDEQLVHLHLVIRLRNTGKFHYSLEVNIW